MKQTYNIEVPKNIEDCNTCMEIIKTSGLTRLEDQLTFESKYGDGDKYNYYEQYFDYSYDVELGRPLLNMFVYEPHICCLQTIKLIQKYYDYKWISAELFDTWMAVNGFDYQLGRSGKLDSLWELRFDYVSKDNCLVSPLESLIEPNLLKSCPIYIYKCNKHQHILHVKIEKCKMDRNKVKLLNKLFPFSSAADKNKTNMDLASLVNYACISGEWDKVNEAFKLFPIGCSNVTATALMIHGLGNKYFNKMRDLIIKDKACCLQPIHLNKYFKMITTALRRTSRWQDGSTANLEEVAMCAYWEQCLGRSKMLSDWEKEMKNRTEIKINLRPPLNETIDEKSNEDYLVEFNISLDIIFAQLIPTCPVYDTFEQFCEKRQSWLSSGSSGGEQIMINDKGVRINKRTYFESISIEEMVKWLDTEPIMKAVASEKFEQSKARAIYGTKPIDYAITAFAMMQAESNLHRVDGLEGGLVGSDEMRSILRRVALFEKDPDTEGLMIDYADFNIQHTLDSQACVFRAMKRRLLFLNVKGDIIKALDWCIGSCLNQWVKFPNSSEYVRSIQGLFSGNRSTNFTNTINNLAYFLTANRWVKEHLNIMPNQLYNLHQGDDVWIAFKNRIWGMALYAVMKNTGFVFQNEKQLQDKSRGEFLRVLYSHEGAMGYVARSIGTFLLRPLQGEDDISPDARCTALNSQIMILSRRGLNNATTGYIWDATIRHAAKSSLPSGDTFTLPLKAIYRNFLDGGLDLGKPGTMSERTDKIAPIPTIQYESPDLFKTVERHTTNAWIKIVSEDYKDKIDSDALGDLLHRINTSDSLRPIDKQRCLSHLHKQLRAWNIKVRDASSVSRSYQVWDDWLIKQVKIDDRLLAVVNRQMSLIPIKRDVNVQKSKIETIIAALSSSPFKDIASAERALHLGKIKSARTAIKCSKNKYLSQEAISIMDSIEVRTSKQVLSRVISGVRGIGGTFEYKLHPIIMSWMNKVCLELALTEAMYSGITEIEDWDRLLYTWQNMGVKCLLNNDTILTISKY